MPYDSGHHRSSRCCRPSADRRWSPSFPGRRAAQLAGKYDRLSRRPAALRSRQCDAEHGNHPPGCAGHRGLSLYAALMLSGQSRRLQPMMECTGLRATLPPSQRESGQSGRMVLLLFRVVAAVLRHIPGRLGTALRRAPSGLLRGRCRLLPSGAKLATDLSHLLGFHIAEMVAPAVADICRDVGDLLVIELIAIRRHHRSTYDDLTDDIIRQLQEWIVAESRADTAEAFLAVADKATALHKYLLAVVPLALSACRTE